MQVTADADAAPVTPTMKIQDAILKASDAGTTAASTSADVLPNKPAALAKYFSPTKKNRWGLQ